MFGDAEEARKVAGISDKLSCKVYVRNCMNVDGYENDLAR